MPTTTQPQTASLTLNGATLTVELTSLFQAWLEKNAATLHAAPPSAAAAIVTPAAPALNPGELYAGIVFGKDGAPSHHVILLPGSIADANWDKAREWAASIGGELPTRREQSLLFTNLKEEFESAWYWSGEQHAANSDYAWYQYFDYGYQDYSLKSSEGRARAVRRLAI